MSEIGSAFVSILPSAKGFGSRLDRDVSGETQGIGKRLGAGFGKAFVAGGAIIAAAGIGKFLKDSIGEARESQKVGAQTNAVIKSTGGVANVTAKSIGQLSTAISKKAGIDDEAIQSGGNLLLTFTNVRNEAGKGNKVFDQTVQAATDMSVALGTDMKSSAMQLGKALNDPIKGVTKLQRSGVTFTDQQKTQIATLVKSGQTLKAQKIILGEVNKEFGGSAAAQATAGDKFEVAFKNLEESIGTALLPVLDKVLNVGTKFATFLTNDISPSISALNGYLAPAITTVKDFFGALGSSGAGSGFLTTIKGIAASIGTNFLPVLHTVVTTFITSVLPAIVSLATYLATNLGPIFTRVGQIISTQVVPIIAKLAQFFYGTLYPAVLKIVAAVATALKPVFDALFAQIQTTILPIVTKLLAKFQEWWPTISKVIVIVLKVIGVLLVLAAKILAVVLPPLIRFAGFLIRTVVGAIVAVISVVVKIIATLIKFGGAVGTAAGKVGAFASTIGTKIGQAIGFIKDLPGKAAAALGDLSGLLIDKGKQIVEGLITGIGKMGKKLAGYVVKFVKDHVPGPVAHVLGISSPSRVMAEQAKWIPLGMIQGIESQASQVDAAMTRLSSRIAVRAPSLAVASAAGSTSGSGPIHIHESQSPDATAAAVARRLAWGA